MNRIIWAESFQEEERAVEARWEEQIPVDFYRAPLQEIDPEQIKHQVLVTIRTHSILTDDWLENAGAVLTRSTGYDHVDADRLSVPTGYLPDYATAAVADHNLMVSRALLRRLPYSSDSIRNFSRDRLTGRELSNVDVGIVGVGRIGKATAERCLSIGANVSGYDVDPTPDWARNNAFEYVDRDHVFSNSDLVILCLPLNESTEKMVTEDDLLSMPARSILVNSGRGEVVSNQALLHALVDGPLEGLALDVFNREREVADLLQGGLDEVPELEPELHSALELIDDKRVLATPHNAFNTELALERKVSDSLDSIKQFLDHGEFPDPVNGC